MFVYSLNYMTILFVAMVISNIDIVGKRTTKYYFAACLYKQAGS